MQGEWLCDDGTETGVVGPQASTKMVPGAGKVGDRSPLGPLYARPCLSLPTFQLSWWRVWGTQTPWELALA